jgi:uncharacterized protein (DUF58 family)
VTAASAASAGSSLALLRQLEWRVRHAVENVLSGEYRSSFRGRGMEFDQVVKYEFGDDVRDIDWNVTARLGEAYRKKFVEEREVTVLIVFEDTPSLRFGSGRRTKRDALLELAGLVMLLGAVNRDRVGFVHASPEGALVRAPVRGRGAIMHAAATLLSRPVPDFQTEPPGAAEGREQTPGLTASNRVPWRFLARAAPKHSVLIWLGDFAPQPAPEGWSVLRRRYQTMGFRVDDAWENNLPAGGLISTYDPAAGQLVTLEGSAAERAAQAAWREQRELAWTELFPQPLSRLVLDNEVDALDTLVRFFKARQHLTGG